MVNIRSDGWKQLKEVMREDRERKARLAKSKSEGDRLYFRLLYDLPQTEGDWLGLYQEVHEFLDGNNPEKEKDRLRQYTEMLAMITSGYESMEG